MQEIEGIRVRRADLHTPPPISQSCSEIEKNKFIKLLAATYGPIADNSNHQSLPTVTNSDHHHNLPAEECQKLQPSKNQKPVEEGRSEIREALDSEREYDFFLFSEGHSTFPQRVFLSSENQQFKASFEKNKSEFLVPHRRASYYFAAQAEDERKSQFFLSAVEGETVKQWSRERAPGLEVPWRVQILKTHNCSKKDWNLNKLSKAIQNKKNCDCGSGTNTLTKFVPRQVQLPNQGNPRTGKKKQPGKKSRISMRKKKRALVALEEQLTQEKQSKEQAEKQKRIRRNREKKVKRKLKKKILRVENEIS